MLSLSQGMVLLYTRVLLEMLSVYAMACNLLYYHHIAYVAPSILWSMPWIAHQEAFLQFDTMRCETTSAFLSEVCHNVHTEPTLQPLQGEHLKYKSANGEVGARLDVAAQNFWGKDHQTAYFDVRIFNPFAQSYANSSISKCYRKHELDKKREYEERVREIEHGSFSPLVFSTAGAMGPIASVQENSITNCWKRQEPYSTTLFWLQCKLSFSLLRSAIMCLRGTRSFHSHSQHHSIIALACVQRQSSLNNLLFASLVFII